MSICLHQIIFKYLNKIINYILNIFYVLCFGVPQIIIFNTPLYQVLKWLLLSVLVYFSHSGKYQYWNRNIISLT